MRGTLWLKWHPHDNVVPMKSHHDDCRAIDAVTSPANLKNQHDSPPVGHEEQPRLLAMAAGVVDIFADAGNAAKSPEHNAAFAAQQRNPIATPNDEAARLPRQATPQRRYFFSANRLLPPARTCRPIIVRRHQARRAIAFRPSPTAEITGDCFRVVKRVGNGIHFAAPDAADSPRHAR